MLLPPEPVVVLAKKGLFQRVTVALPVGHAFAELMSLPKGDAAS